MKVALKDAKNVTFASKLARGIRHTVTGSREVRRFCQLFCHNVETCWNIVTTPDPITSPRHFPSSMIDPLRPKGFTKILWKRSLNCSLSWLVIRLHCYHIHATSIDLSKTRLTITIRVLTLPSHSFHLKDIFENWKNVVTTVVDLPLLHLIGNIFIEVTSAKKKSDVLVNSQAIHPHTSFRTSVHTF